MDGIIEWFSDNLKSILIGLVNAIIEWIINPAILAFSDVFQVIASFLPDNSLTINAFSSLFDSDVVAWLNWFLPIPSFITGLGIICASYIAKFAIGPVLRLFKLIS